VLTGCSQANVASHNRGRRRPGSFSSSPFGEPNPQSGAGCPNWPCRNSRRSIHQDLSGLVPEVAPMVGNDGPAGDVNVAGEIVSRAACSARSSAPGQPSAIMNWYSLMLFTPPPFFQSNAGSVTKGSDGNATSLISESSVRCCAYWFPGSLKSTQRPMTTLATSPCRGPAGISGAGLPPPP